MDIFLTTLPLSLASGINLYFTVFLVGLIARYELIQPLPPGVDVLASWPVIISAGVIGLLEFFADKVPLVDSIWDVFHTIVRPAGAVALAFGLTQNMDPALSTTVAIVAGGTAFTSHTSKMGFRALVNTSPEPASNIVVSLLEDLLVFGMVALAMKYPYVAAGVAVVILVLMLWLIPMLLRWALFWARALRARLRAQVQGWEPLPDAHHSLVTSPDMTLQCSIRGPIRASGKRGYITATADHLVFTYGRLIGGAKKWEIPLDHIDEMTYHRGLLMNLLEVQCHDDRKREVRMRFVFLKDHADQSQRFAALLGAEGTGDTRKPLVTAASQ